MRVNTGIDEASFQAIVVADEANDEPTLDLPTQRMQTHAKNAWTPRSLLDS